MLNKITGTTAALMGLGLALGVAVAAISPATLVRERQVEMKASGRALKALAAMNKDAAKFDAATVAKLAGAISGNFDKMWKDNVWDAATNVPGADTNAKPEVWNDAAGFDAARRKLVDASAQLAAVTDAASLKAALPAVGEACKSCHQTYRKAD